MRRAVIGTVLVAAVVGATVIALFLVGRSQEEESQTGRAVIFAAMTKQGLETRSMLDQNASATMQAQFTATPTATATTPATSTQDTASICVSGERFQLRFPDNEADLVLVADGRSTRHILVESCDSTFNGRVVTLYADGGGQVDQSQIRLETTPQTVTFTAGLTASTIIIYGLISDGIQEYRSEIRFSLMNEQVTVVVDFDSIDGSLPVSVPLSVEVLAGERPAVGEYHIRLYAGSSGQVMRLGEVPQRSLDVIFRDGALQDRVYYVPDVNATEGIVQAYAIGHEEITPAAQRVFWTNLTERLEFTSYLAGQAAGIDEWNTYVPYPLCLEAYSAAGALIAPNFIRLRASVIPQMPRPLVGGEVLPNGEWVTSGEQILPPTQNSRGASCFSLIMESGTHSIRVIRLDARAERHRIHDSFILFSHQGAISQWMNRRLPVLAFYSEAEHASTGSFVPPDGAMITLYRDASRSNQITGADVYSVLLWASNEQIDLSRSILRASSEVMVYAGNSSAPTSLAVMLNVTADTPVLLLDSANGTLTRFALSLTIPASILLPTPTPILATGVPPMPPFSTATPLPSPIFPTMAPTAILSPTVATNTAVMTVSPVPSATDTEVVPTLTLEPPPTDTPTEIPPAPTDLPTNTDVPPPPPTEFPTDPSVDPPTAEVSG